MLRNSEFFRSTPTLNFFYSQSQFSDLPSLMTSVSYHPAIRVYLQAIRLEAWFKCTSAACGHEFFRDLTPDATCTHGRCTTRSPPVKEIVTSGQIISSFQCLGCSHCWTHVFNMQKQCNRCGVPAVPVISNAAIGIASVRCTGCHTVAYEVRAKSGDMVQCRKCESRRMPAVVVCSSHKHRAIEELVKTYSIEADNLIICAQSRYIPGTSQTRTCRPLTEDRSRTYNPYNALPAA